jgi:hypothetical protein
VATNPEEQCSSDARPRQLLKIKSLRQIVIVWLAPLQFGEHVFPRHLRQQSVEPRGGVPKRKRFLFSCALPLGRLVSDDIGEPLIEATRCESQPAKLVLGRLFGLGLFVRLAEVLNSISDFAL